MTKGLVSRLLKSLIRLMRWSLLLLGAGFAIVIVFSLTSWPFWILYSWGLGQKPECAQPAAIIMLGAAGMPGEGNLMRCYFAAQAAMDFPDIPLIVALPGDTADSTGTLALIAGELISKGVSASRIVFENEGTNTRWQALNVVGKAMADTAGCVALVTSPDHMYRSIRTFRMVGFRQIYPVTASEGYIHTDLAFTRSDTGGRTAVPDVGNNIGLRYRFWTHLKYTILITREGLAIGYYKLNGWI